MFSLSKPIHGKQVKVIFLGDDQVGKTSIIRRFADNVFRENYRPTLGVQVITKENYEFPPNSGQKLIIYLWDIGAQQLYEVVRPDYYVGISAAIFVGDVTRPESVQNIDYWFKEIKMHVRYPHGWMVALNKVDAVEDNEKPKNLVSLLPESLQNKDHIVFTSAKENRNIEILIKKPLSQVVKSPIVKKT